MFKKSLQILILLMAMASSWTAMGQTIQIGNGTSTTWSVPINIRDNYSYGQMIYAKNDIEAGNPKTDTIIGIAFEHNGNANINLDITVYMKNIDYETFSTTTFEPVTDADIVYQGTVKPISGWVQLNLDNPFINDPDRHLLVAINKTGGGSLSNNYQWRYETKYNSVLYNSTYEEPSRTEPYDPAIDFTGHQNYKLPNIRIIFQERPVPTDLTATMIDGDGTTAIMTWTENGPSSTWVLEYDTEEDFSTATAVNLSGTPEVTLTNLVTGTKYYARVKSLYSDLYETSWSTVISFIPTLSYSITLNDVAETSSYVPFYRQVGSNSSIMSQFILPVDADLIKVQSGDITKITFYATHQTYDYGAATFKVYVKEVTNTTLSSAYVDWAELTEVYDGSVNINYGKLELTFDTPYTYNGGNLLIGFKKNGAGGTNPTETIKWYGDASKPSGSSRYSYGSTNKVLGYLPKITINYTPGTACNTPLNVAATLETRTATLTWLSNASQWQVAHSTSATDDPNGHIVPGYVNAKTFSMDNLTAGTHYFWVRSYCGNDEYSEWTEPVSVEVVYCSPVATSTDGNGISNVTFGVGDYIVNNDTPKAGYANYSNLIGAVQAGVTSNVAITYATGYDYVTLIWVDLNNNMTFEDSEILYVGKSTSSNPTTLTATVEIPPTQELGDYRMRIGGADIAFDAYYNYIKGTSQDPVAAPDACGTYSYSCFQDYTLRVLEAPDCLPANQLAVTAEGTTATFTWYSDAEEWDIAHSTLATADPMDCVVATEVPTTSYQMEDLSLGNHYFWVRTHCGMELHSPWAGPVSVHIGYCEPNPSSVDGNGISNVTFGTEGQIVNNDTPKANYADYTNLAGAMRAGLTSHVDITYVTGYTYGTIIWVDWDRDFEFEESEISYAGMSTNDNPTTLTASIHVPATQALGNYIMRIGGADSAFDSYINYINGLATEYTLPDPCYTGTFACFQDYTLCVIEAPSCLPPSDLTATEDQPHQSVLGWTAYGEQTTWQLYYKKQTEENYTELLVNENPYTLEGLSGATRYQYYVVAKCSDTETSEPSDVYSFTTSCPEYIDIPFSENFDSYQGASSGTQNNLPHCWNYINTCSNSYYSGYPVVFNSSTDSRSGNNHLRFYSYDYQGQASYDPQDQYAILPQVESVSGLRMKLYARISATNTSYMTYNATFHVGVMTDPADATTFEEIGTYTPQSTAYEMFIIPMDTYTGAGKYIAIKVDKAEQSSTNYTVNSVYIDDVVVEEIPVCLEPSALAEVPETATQTSLTLQWTAAGSETAWKVQYKKAVATEWTTVAAPATVIPYTLTGLDNSSIYNVRVAAWCDITDPDGISEYCEPISASTMCGPVTSFPWSENFEAYNAGDFNGVCWENEHIEGDGVQIFKINTYNIGNNNTHTLQLPDMTQGTLTKLRLPEMSLPSDNYQFVIDVYRNNSSYNASTVNEGIRVYASTNGEIDGATELAFISRQYNAAHGNIPAEASEGWYTYELPIGFAGTCYIILRGESQYCTSTYMDNFIVEQAPTCIKPSSFVCDLATAHTAKLSWVSGSSTQDAWQIAMSTETNFNPDELEPQSLLNVTATSTTLTDLTANTTYYAYVRAYCGGDDYSSWCTNKLTFTTTIANAVPVNLACDPASITSTHAKVTWEAIQSNDNHQSFDLYYSTTDAMPEPLVTESLIEGIVTSSYEFDNLLHTTTYYVWVRDNCGEDGYSAWSASNSFTTASSCQTPDNPVASAMTINSAKITWNTYGLNEFNLRYKIEDGEWTLINNVNSPYVITGLSGNTEYFVQVQAACNTDEWSETLSFYTDCTAYTITETVVYRQNFEKPVTTAVYNSSDPSHIVVPHCWENYSTNTTTVYTQPHLIAAGSSYNYATSGQVLYFYGSGSNYAVMPEFTNPLNELQLDFKFATESNSAGTLQVGYITDSDVDFNTFTSIKEYNASDTYHQTLTPIHIYLSDVPAEASRLVFCWYYSSWYGANIDDVEVSLLPSCMPVNGFRHNTSTVQSTSVGLLWILIDKTQTEWQLCINDDEEHLININTDDVSVNPMGLATYTLNGLDPSTTYTVKLRSYCDSENQSTWSDNTEFTTAESCAAPSNITIANITQNDADISWMGDSDSYNLQYGYDNPDLDVDEDFENGLIPNYWDNSSSDYPWEVVTEGGKHFIRSTNQGINSSTSSIKFEVSLYEDGFVSFDAKCMGEGTNYDVCTFYIDDEVQFSKGANGDQWDFYTFEIEEGDHTLMWSYTKDSSVSATGDAFSVDNVKVGYHNMVWTEEDNLLTPNTHVASLIVGTRYEVQVQGVCGGVAGNWSDVATFTTLDEHNIVFPTNGDWTAGGFEPAGMPTINDDVIIRADANIPANTAAVVNNLSFENNAVVIVESGATLTIAGDATGGTAASIIIEDGGQLIHANQVNATLQKNITAPTNWKDDEDAGWFLIATPAEYNVISTTFTGSFDLYKYSEPDAMWYTWTGGASTFSSITRMNGYLHASQIAQTESFAGVMTGTESTLTKSNLSWANSVESEKGFNLVGNPFTRNLTKGDMTLGGEPLTKYYVINDAQHSKLTAVDDDSYEIKPGEGFFVQATAANQDLVFNPISSKDEFNIGYIKIVAGNENGFDNAYIQLERGNTLRKMNIANKTSVYVINNGDDYAAATIDELTGSMPVHFKAIEDGVYKISFSTKYIEASTMLLYDNFTGETIDLLEAPNYTFKAAATDDENRFKLMFDFNNYAGVDENGTGSTFAYQMGDEIFVNGDGTLQVFDVLGRFVKSTEVHGSERVSVSQLNTGVYIFRLVGETIKTQKLIVR